MNTYLTSCTITKRFYQYGTCTLYMLVIDLYITIDSVLFCTYRLVFYISHLVVSWCMLQFLLYFCYNLLYAWLFTYYTLSNVSYYTRCNATYRDNDTKYISYLMNMNRSNIYSSIWSYCKYVNNYRNNLGMRLQYKQWGVIWRSILTHQYICFFKE